MKTTKKYKLIPDKASGLFRIKALRDITDYGIVKGDLGGLVETAENLAQDGDCWISDSGKVTGGASVVENALVSGTVRGRAVVGGFAFVSEGSGVRDNAYVYGRARIIQSCVRESAQVYGCATVRDGAEISGSARILDYACVMKAAVTGGACVYGASRIEDRVIISKTEHVVHIIGTRHPITVTRGGFISIGCLHGSLAWFITNRRDLVKQFNYSRAEVKVVTALVLAALQQVRRR